MNKLLRFLFQIPKPIINQDVALRIAEEYFNKNGIKFDQPKTIEELRSWFIWANCNIKPSQWVRIDNQKGEIIEFGRPSR